MLLPFVIIIARCPESSFRWPSTRKRENGTVGFVHSLIPRVLAVMGACKIQRELNAMSFLTAKFFYGTQATLNHPCTGLIRFKKIFPGNPIKPMFLTAGG